MIAHAHLGRQSWRVAVERQLDGSYLINGRCTEIQLLVLSREDGHLVALPGLKRAGEVPAMPNGHDIQTYCEVDNPVDAETIAVAVRLIEQTEEKVGKE